MRGYQEMAAKGLIIVEELEEKLLNLEEIPQDGQARATSPARPRERSEELEQDKDALLESYAGMAPEARASLTPEERHKACRTLRLRVIAYVYDALELSGALVRTQDVGNLKTLCS